MIAALLFGLYVLLFGGGGIEGPFDVKKKDLEHAVADSGVRSQILELTERLDKDLEKNRKQRTETLDKLLRVQHGYESPAEDFEAEAQRLEELLGERYSKIFATRSALKDLMSEAEWSAVIGKR